MIPNFQQPCVLTSLSLQEEACTYKVRQPIALDGAETEIVRLHVCSVCIAFGVLKILTDQYGRETII